MTKKALCWWIGYIHHVSAILDLDTEHGPISVLPDYTDVNFIELPDFALRAINQARTTADPKAISTRWTQLQELTKNNKLWTFYGIPHAKLIALENMRPAAALWPRLGVRGAVLRRGIRNLEEGKAGVLTRLFASNYPDGFTYTKRDSRTQSAVKESTAKKGRAKKALKGGSSSAPSLTETDEGMSHPR